MFELTRQVAKLTNVNPRAERHGEDTKLAADLGFQIKVSNDVLSFFDASLKSALYKKPDGDQQELIEDPGYLPALKFPQMGAIKWGKDFAGYEVVVHYGVSEKDDIVLIDCEVDHFRFECQDGGTVVVGFRVIAHPEAPELGRLCEMIQNEVDVTLVAPTLEEQIDRELEEEGAE